MTEMDIIDVRRPIFMALLKYLYTDEIEVAIENTMELFVAADKYGVDRLKKMCENRLLASLNIENAASLFHAADLHHAMALRERSFTFMQQHFDAVE